MISGFNISPQQSRIWSLQRDSYTPYLTGSVLIDGEIAATILEDRLKVLVMQHSILRTGYFCRPGVIFPLQVIKEQGNYQFNFTDLMSLPEDQQDEKIAAWERSPLPATTDYETVIPLSVHLFQLQETRCLLGISMVALSADTCSLLQIARFLCGTAQEQVEIIQYVQFSEWQHKLLKTPPPDATAFWQTNSPKDDVFTTLPFCKVSGNEMPAGIGSQTLTFAKELTEKLSERLQQTELDASSMFLACLVLLLHRHQETPDVVIGKIEPNRRYAQLQPTIGPLEKMIPLTITPDTADSFAQLWQTTKSVADNAAQWVEYFSPDYLMSRQLYDESFIMSVGFEYIDVSALFPSKENKFVWKTIMNNAEQFRLKFTCTRFVDGYKITCHYDTGSFNADDVAALLDQFETLLHHAACSPDLPLNKYSALSQTAALKVMNDFNPSPVQYSAEGIVRLFRRQVNQTPANTALVYGEITLSYSELDELSDRIARHLAAQFDIGNGKFAVVLMDNSNLSVAVILAILKTGAAYIPVDIREPVNRVQYIVETTAPAVIILEDESLLQGLAGCAVSKLLLQKGFVSSIQDQVPLPEDIDLSALAYVMHTSGSSGNPKGVKITHGNLVNYVRWANEYYFNNASGKPFALFTALTFDLTITSIFTTLLRGDTIMVYPAAADPGNVLADVFRKETGIAAVKLTPSHVSMLKFIDLSATNVQYAILGGEALTQSHVEILRSLNPQMRIFNEYGPTECTVGATVAELSFENKPVAIGKPVANTRVFILNGELDPVAVGEAGEICIAGAGVSPGYLQANAAADSRFVTGRFRPGERLYRTGDRGMWLPDGVLMYLGRIDNQVKIRGHRIEPGEIENVLLTIPEVKETAVIAEGDDPLNRYLTAFIVVEGIPDEASIKSMLTAKLPSHMIPSFLVFPDKIPLSTHGKTDYKKLSELSGSRRDVKSAFVVPGNDIERRLLEVWKEVLPLETISVRDNFFMIGGHSIKALQIISRISREFQVEASLADMFADPTIEGMGKLLGHLNGNTVAPLRKIEDQSSYEVSYAQRRLWISDKAAANKIAYNMPGVFLFEGRFDKDAFNKALGTVIERHESLRTTFISENGHPRQVIHAVHETQNGIDCVELGDESLLGNLIHTEVNTPFDLEKGPLFRIKIFLIGEEKAVIVSTTHHIISDAWSIGIMIREISALYNSFIQAAPCTLPLLNIQYKDFAAWQNNRLENEPEHGRYWKSKLEQLPPPLSLPGDFPRPAVRSFRGSKISCIIAADTTSSMEQLGKENGVSLFTVLFSGLYTLLYSLTDQQDLIIGTSVAGRDHIDLEHQIGMFVNLLAIRTSFNSSASFLDLLKQVNVNILEALSHQLYPFDKIVEDLQLPRDTGRSPFFDILLVLQNTAISAEYDDLSGLSVNNVDVNIEKSEFDLVLNVIPTGENLSVVAHYNTEIFEEITIHILMEKWKKIFHDICKNPQIPLNEIVVQLDEEAKLKENTTNLEFNFN